MIHRYMATAWVDERPRQLAVPMPVLPMHTAARAQCKSAREETIKALREKLGEFQAENTLLGTLVKELKVERDGLQKRLSCSVKQHSDASNRAATAQQQADTVGRDHKRLAAEVERLSSVVHSHSVRLQKAKQHQQELEDVALDLRAELDEARAKQEAAEMAAAAATQRATAAEAKLEAAGLGAMPKMGPTAEQLVINSTQRIRELTEELASLKADQEQQQADAQEQLQQKDKQLQQEAAQWQQQLDQAKAAAQTEQQQLKQQLQQREQELQQQSRRVQESEQQCRDLQQQLSGCQHSLMEAQRSTGAYQELQRVQQTTVSLSQSLQQQVAHLQQQLTNQEAAHAAAMIEQQQRAAALEREKHELVASLAILQQHDSSQRLTAAEASSKIERLRGELLRCVGELQTQLASAATLGQQQQQAQQQLRAMEATAGAARAEAAETRQQLVELATVSLEELREQVACEAVAITGLPDDLDPADLPAPVGSYIKVLEHAVCDCEKRSKQMLADALAAQQHERDARQALASAREAQAAAERALQQQTQRLLAAERMRLSDIKEQQSLERRLVCAQQECASLRDALIGRASNGLWQQVPQPSQLQQLLQPQVGSPSASIPGTGAAGGPSADGLQSPTKWAFSLAAGKSPLPHEPDAGGGSARTGNAGLGGGHGWGAAGANSQQGTITTMAGDVASCGPETDGKEPSLRGMGHLTATPQQQQQQQRRRQQQGMWQPPAADAVQAGPDVAAHSAASINRYQAKLAQLRQMKEQLLRRNCADVATPDLGTATAGTQSPQHHQQQQQAVVSPSGPLQQPASLPPASALIWSPRSVVDDWTIGCGSSGGQRVSSLGRASLDCSTGCDNSSVAHSSSGGGSASTWSTLGRPAASSNAGGEGPGPSLGSNGSGGGVASVAAGVPCGVGTHKPVAVGLSRLGSAPASGAMSQANNAPAGRPQHQQPQGQQVLGTLGSMKHLVKAATSTQQGPHAATAATAPHNQSHKHQHSNNKAAGGWDAHGDAGAAPAKELPGCAGHGLSTGVSHLQRWAQPRLQEVGQQQQERQQSQLSRQHRASSGSSRRSSATVSGTQAYAG